MPDLVERYFEAAVRALVQLDAQQLFDVGNERDQYMLLFEDSDAGPTKSHVRRLNPQAVYDRYADCFYD